MAMLIFYIYLYYILDEGDACIVNADCQGENQVCNSQRNVCAATETRSIGTQTDEITAPKSTGAIKKRSSFAKTVSTTIREDNAIGRAACKLFYINTENKKNELKGK